METALPLLTCLRMHCRRHCEPFNSQKCTKLYDFAYTSSKFFQGDAPRSPQARSWCFDPDTNFGLARQHSYCSCFTKWSLVQTLFIPQYLPFIPTEVLHRQAIQRKPASMCCRHETQRSRTRDHNRNISCQVSAALQRGPATPLSPTSHPAPDTAQVLFHIISGLPFCKQTQILPFSLTFLDETAIERPMWHLKKRPKYRCFRAKLLMPDANVIKSAAHTSPWTGGDTAAAAYVCPAVVVSLLINHHSLLCGAPVALCIRLADWWSGGACPRVWADEGEGEREAAG